VRALYKDTSGKYTLKTGQGNGGRIVTQYSGSDDFGTPIQVRVSLKQDNLDKFELMKEFKYLVLHLRDTSGTITVKVLQDGTVLAKQYVKIVSSSIGKSERVWGTKRFGAGFSSSATTRDPIFRPNERFRARALSLEITKSDEGDFVLMDYGFTAKLYSPSYYPSSERISASDSANTALDTIVELTIDGGTS
jgi:hypothetical protein